MGFHVERLSVDYGKKTQVSITVRACPQVAAAVIRPCNIAFFRAHPWSAQTSQSGMTTRRCTTSDDVGR